MAHIAMLLSNPFRPDPRVLKEARSLSQRGFTVTIICWDRKGEYPDGELLEDGLRVIRVKSISSDYALGARQIGRLYRFWQAAMRILQQIKPDLVHCHDFDTLPAGIFWSRRHHKPVLYDAHEYYADLVKPRLKGLTGSWLYAGIKFAERNLARRADAVITVDETLADIYRSINPRVLVVGHYPPLDLCSTHTNVFRHPELNLLYIGRISGDRGSIAYLEILRRLHARDIPACLLLAGAFTPAAEEQLFWQNAQGLEAHIKYNGWVQYDQVHEILQQADVGLALLQPEPRYVAALPVKLFEYMAAGLPVIGSNFPHMASVITTSKCGAVADPTDCSAAVDVLCSWWQDQSIPIQMGENGRMAIRNIYNWESLIASLDDLYQSVL